MIICNDRCPHDADLQLTAMSWILRTLYLAYSLVYLPDDVARSLQGPTNCDGPAGPDISVHPRSSQPPIFITFRDPSSTDAGNNSLSSATYSQNGGRPARLSRPSQRLQPNEVHRCPLLVMAPNGLCPASHFTSSSHFVREVEV
jgi:hypothetical protein